MYKTHIVINGGRWNRQSIAAALDRGDFESGSGSKSGVNQSDREFPISRSLRRRGGGLRPGYGEQE